MILLNLLPHRAAKRAQRKRAYFFALGAAAVLGGVLGGLWWTWVVQSISIQQSRNEYLIAGIKKLDAQIKDVGTIKEEINALRERQKSVEDLQSGRNAPVHLLEGLVLHLPEGVQISSLKQSGNKVSVSGVAQSNERVSELLRNLSRDSKWLHRPELQEIRGAVVGTGARESRRVVNFSMSFELRAAEAPAASETPAPSAPAPKKS